ncbi:MAG TPA: hypothetical protein VKT82_04820 [Ktedonobacterales bacterium]|nr:hypothetical protein [Ktedonobacterales bacterium]
MNPSRRAYHTLSAIALLSLLVLAACGSSPSNPGVTTVSTPTSIPPTATPTPTSPPQPVATPTTPPGTLLGGNIIVNGNAEQGKCAPDTSTVISPITGWTPTNNITPIQYAVGANSNGDLSPTTPGPGDAGNCYFWGGPEGSTDNTTTSMRQMDNVSSVAAMIDSKAVTYDLSAWLGGYSDQDDNATLSIQFLGQTGNALGTATIGPVMAADRNNTSELLLRSTTGQVPVGTRSIKVTLTMTKTAGSDNDGLADDLSLLLVQQS